MIRKFKIVEKGFTQGKPSFSTFCKEVGCLEYHLPDFNVCEKHYKNTVFYLYEKKWWGWDKVRVFESYKNAENYIPTLIAQTTMLEYDSEDGFVLPASERQKRITHYFDTL